MILLASKGFAFYINKWANVPGMLQNLRWPSITWWRPVVEVDDAEKGAWCIYLILKQRWLDIQIRGFPDSEPEVRETFKQRTATNIPWWENYLNERGYLEVETPRRLQPLYGELQQDHSLRTTMALDMQPHAMHNELQWQRSIVGGRWSRRVSGAILEMKRMNRFHNPNSPNWIMLHIRLSTMMNLAEENMVAQAATGIYGTRQQAAG